MKLTAFLLLLLVLPNKQEADMKQVRDLFSRAVFDKKKTQELLDYLQQTKASFLSLGYLGCANMLMAKHSLNPIIKYNCFIDGKNQLEDAIHNDPRSAELRYLRFSFQANTPSFLNYKCDIYSDKIFLINSILHRSVENSLVRQNIIKILAVSEYCSDVEKKMMKEAENWKM